MDTGKLNLLDERTYWVGDRVIASQIVMFLVAGAIALLIEVAGISNAVITYLWWLFTLVLPISGLVLLIVYANSLYFDHHWHTSFALLLITWAPLVIFLGVLFDEILVGVYNAFWLSAFLSLILGAGYGFAKILRVWRNSRNVWVIGATISIIIILVSIFTGVILYEAAAQAHPYGILFWEVYECQGCLFGVYIIIGGIGIVTSMALYSYMFHCLFDPKGLDVEEDPPNELYLKIMRVSLILCLISYLLLLIFIPPIAGGGKGRKGGRIRAPRRTARTVYLGTRHYGKRDKHPRERVEEEWEEHELGS